MSKNYEPLKLRTLLIDNYDSYTFNIFQALRKVNGIDPILVQNDDFDSSWEKLCLHLVPGKDFHNVVISPGPGSPSVRADVGMCPDAIESCLKTYRIPIFGVCLGHQMLANVFGAKIGLAPTPMHGRLSKVYHDGFKDPQSIFFGIPSGFEVVRYHSLAIEGKTLPSTVQEKAFCDSSTVPLSSMQNSKKGKVIMAIQVTETSQEYEDLPPCWGVQFHPESVSTQYGIKLFENFGRLTTEYLTRSHRKCISQKNVSNEGLNDTQSFLHQESGIGLQRNEVNVKATPEKQFAVFVTQLHMKINERIISPEEYFEDAFSVARGTMSQFWLDSATCQWGRDQTSPKTSQSRGRFSYMGDSEGPNSKLVEFCLNNTDRTFKHETSRGSNDLIRHKLRVSQRTPEDKAWEVSENSEKDIFSYLDSDLLWMRNQSKLMFAEELIENEKLRFSEIEFDSWDKDFEFLCGYVGFFGYGLRKLCGVKSCGVHSLETSRSVKAEPFLAPNLPRACNNQSNMNDEFIPDSAFLFADRMMVWDHHEQKVYLLAWDKTDERERVESWMRKMRTTMVRTLHPGGERTTDPASVIANELIGTTLEEEKGYSSAEKEVAFSLSKKHKSFGLSPDVNDLEYKASIERSLNLINVGQTYEVCLTRQLCSNRQVLDPKRFYVTLRNINPAPYGAFFSVGSDSSLQAVRNDQSCKNHSCFSICSSSPERFIHISGNGKVESKPIKGTIRRGNSEEEDEELATKLRMSDKDRAENLMIVDLVRNDLGRVCESVEVPKLMHVESFETVHQLVSTVTGTIDRAKHSTVETIRAAFPGGSMTGAPKLRTMQIIDELEKSERGVYSGSLGYLSLSGAADLNIVIRTAVLTPNGVSVGTGGAIVALSDASEELHETYLKANAIDNALKKYFQSEESL